MNVKEVVFIQLHTNATLVFVILLMEKIISFIFTDKYLADLVALST